MVSEAIGVEVVGRCGGTFAGAGSEASGRIAPCKLWYVRHSILDKGPVIDPSNAIVGQHEAGN